jgi:6-phosphogluconate dehydrogenase (decarboxylating)
VGALEQREELIDDLGRLTLGDNELVGDLRGTELVELVDRGADGGKVGGGDTTCLKHGIEQAAVIELDEKLRHLERVERLHEQRDALGVGHHGVVFASNVEIALTKLAITALAGLVAAIDETKLIALDVLHAVLRHVACEWHSQVVSKSGDFAALVGEVVDEFRVFAIFACQC